MNLFAGIPLPLSDIQYAAAYQRFRQYAGFNRTETDFADLLSTLGVLATPVVKQTPEEKARAANLAFFIGTGSAHLFLTSGARRWSDGSVTQPIWGMGAFARWVDDLNPDYFASMPGSTSSAYTSNSDGLHSASFSGHNWMDLTIDAGPRAVVVAARSTGNFANDQAIVNPCIETQGADVDGYGLIKFTSTGASAIYGGIELAAPFERDDKPKVITAKLDDNGLASLRVNGVDMVSGVQVGPNPYGQFIGKIGRANTADTAFLTGNVYALVFLYGGIPQEEELLAIEQWFNSLAPSTVMF